MKHLKILLLLLFSTVMVARKDTIADTINHAPSPVAQKEQQQSRKSEGQKESKGIENNPTHSKRDANDIMPWLIALAMLIVTIIDKLLSNKKVRQQERIRLEEQERHKQEIQSLNTQMARMAAIAEDKGHKQFQDAENQKTAKTAEQILNDALTSEPGSIRLLGSPDIQNRLGVSGR